MPRLEALPVLVWAIIGFASWRSSALLHAWSHSPLDRFGWLAFAIWTLPSLAYLARRDPEDTPPPERTLLLAGSLAASLAGTVGDVNAANYLGLALAIAAIPGASIRTVLWLGAAISWMPALSWLAQGTPRAILITGRLLIAAAGVAVTLIPMQARYPRPTLPQPSPPRPLS